MSKRSPILSELSNYKQGDIPSVSKLLGLPTVKEIIELPEFQRGHPVVEAGSRALNRPVRWVHISELADIGNLLKGGELILSTGIALPNSSEELAKYIDNLASAGVTGLVIELGRRFSKLPTPLIQSAEASGLPLISLHTEVQFVSITEAAHSAIISSEIKQLQLRELIHEAFHDLATEATSPQDIIDRMAELAQCPVIFESVNRHVLNYSQMHGKSSDSLENWEARSREAGWANHTDVLGIDCWLTTPVSARGLIWGRLIFIQPSSAASHLTTIIEQGATTLALHLLLDRDESLLEHQTHRSLIGDIIYHKYASPEEIHARAQAIGVTTRRKTLIAMVIRVRESANVPDIAQHARARETVVSVSHALSDIKIPGLVGLLDAHRIAVFLTTTSANTFSPFLEGVARAIHKRIKRLSPATQFVIGVGSSVSSIDELRISFAEADEAADAALSLPDTKLYTTTDDIHLRGLIYLLRDDQHLQRYAERELGSLITYDNRHHTELVKTLAAYLEAGGNKSLAASRANTSRATLYSQLEKIESILKCDLDNPDWRYSLFVALLTSQSLS